MIKTGDKLVFNGYHDKPYYGDGSFTIGRTYTALCDEEETNPFITDTILHDDDGGPMWEEVKYFSHLNPGGDEEEHF